MKLKVNYKSGHAETFEVSEYDFAKRTDGSMNFSWKQDKKCSPGYPVFLNLEEVESIWNIGVKEDES
jgi:hypothetical protein